MSIKASVKGEITTVCEKDKCAGCMACIDKCPKDAIHIEDSIYSFNAIIDTKKCINCNACKKVCHINSSPILHRPLFWKQGWARDENIRIASSSGGAAAALERTCVKNGGIVISCVFESGKFVFREARSLEEISSFIGSKYIKSNPRGVYKRIGKYLKDGLKVLFVGLPCQAAACKNYFGNNEMLTVVDLICHGTPSPKIFDMFMSENGYELKKMKKVLFRVKGNFGITSGEKGVTPPGIRDFYTKTFLESVDYTENCYSCPYARLERVSDITIGDSWGTELDESEQAKGISLILCNTERGAALLTQSDMELFDVDLKKAISINDQLDHPSIKPEIREKFIKGIMNGKSFNRVMFECFPKRYIKNEVKSLLINLRIIRGGV